MKHDDDDVQPKIPTLSNRRARALAGMTWPIECREDALAAASVSWASLSAALVRLRAYRDSLEAQGLSKEAEAVDVACRLLRSTRLDVHEEARALAYQLPYNDD